MARPVTDGGSEAANRATTRTPARTVLALMPVDKRHRAHRLASSCSQGCGIAVKSMAATCVWVSPRLRSRHTSRGYSTSHPHP